MGQEYDDQEPGKPPVHGDDREDQGDRGDDEGGRGRKGWRAGSVPGSSVRGRQDWFSRLILWLTAIVVGLVLLVIAAAYLPGWWAHRVADVAAGNQVAAVLGGLACGAVFSALPLLAMRSAVRPGLRPSARLVRVLEAVLLTVPNLLTLGVATRSGQDGEVARAVLDGRAPGFAVSTLFGALAGGALVVASWVLLTGRRRRLHELDDLRTRLKVHESRSRPEPDPAPDRDPKSEA